MSKKVAVILSGCGFRDGSEIHETTLALLRLDQKGIEYHCFAPNIEQYSVVDHRTGEAMAEESRNVLTESARLTREGASDLAELEAEYFDAVILPGGHGVDTNLSNFVEAGTTMRGLDDLARVLGDFHDAGKPIGLICAASLLAPRLLGQGIAVTIGRDPSMAGAISSMGGLHRSCGHDEIVVDFGHRVVTTPAFMLGTRISEAAVGIFKLVDKLDEMMR